jgi:hypothetical protein
MLTWLVDQFDWTEYMQRKYCGWRYETAVKEAKEIRKQSRFHVLYHYWWISLWDIPLGDWRLNLGFHTPRQNLGPEGWQWCFGWFRFYGGTGLTMGDGRFVFDYGLMALGFNLHLNLHYRCDKIQPFRI